jgi:hypothetical protein
MVHCTRRPAASNRAVLLPSYPPLPKLCTHPHPGSIEGHGFCSLLIKLCAPHTALELACRLFAYCLPKPRLRTNLGCTCLAKWNPSDAATGQSAVTGGRCATLPAPDNSTAGGCRGFTSGWGVSGSHRCRRVA